MERMTLAHKGFRFFRYFRCLWNNSWFTSKKLITFVAKSEYAHEPDTDPL